MSFEFKLYIDSNKILHLSLSFNFARSCIRNSLISWALDVIIYLLSDWIEKRNIFAFTWESDWFVDDVSIKESIILWILTSLIELMYQAQIALHVKCLSVWNSTAEEIFMRWKSKIETRASIKFIWLLKLINQKLSNMTDWYQSISR